MKIKYLDFFNKAVDCSEFITNNKLTIEKKQIDLKDLAIKKYKDLTHITIKSCTVLNQDTNFSIFQKLEKLSCHHNQLTTLPDLSNCSQLKELYCNNNQLTTLSDLSKCSQLQDLYCRNNQLTTLPDLSMCSKLYWLNCQKNQLTSCKSFYSVYKYNFNISNNPIPQIEFDFVKNVNGINDYYFDLFNYCVENDISMKDFLNIEWSKDFYNTYIKKNKITYTKKVYRIFKTHLGF